MSNLLDNLPDEIVLDIFQFASQRPTHIISLSHVCKRFARVANTPYLWHNTPIHQRFNMPAKQNTLAKTGTFQPVGPILLLLKYFDTNSPVSPSNSRFGVPPKADHLPRPSVFTCKEHYLETCRYLSRLDQKVFARDNTRTWMNKYSSAFETVSFISTFVLLLLFIFTIILSIGGYTVRFSVPITIFNLIGALPLVDWILAPVHFLFALVGYVFGKLSGAYNFGNASIFSVSANWLQIDIPFTSAFNLFLPIHFLAVSTAIIITIIGIYSFLQARSKSSRIAVLLYIFIFMMGYGVIHSVQDQIATMRTGYWIYTFFPFFILLLVLTTLIARDEYHSKFHSLIPYVPKSPILIDDLVFYSIYPIVLYTVAATSIMLDQWFANIWVALGPIQVEMVILLVFLLARGTFPNETRDNYLFGALVCIIVCVWWLFFSLCLGVRGINCIFPLFMSLLAGLLALLNEGWHE